MQIAIRKTLKLSMWVKHKLEKKAGSRNNKITGILLPVTTHEHRNPPGRFSGNDFG